MRTRDVVGRKIVALKQARIWNENTGSWVIDFRWLELDNGTRLYPVPVELPYDIATELFAAKRKKGTKCVTTTKTTKLEEDK